MTWLTWLVALALGGCAQGGREAHQPEPGSLPGSPGPGPKGSPKVGEGEHTEQSVQARRQAAGAALLQYSREPNHTHLEQARRHLKAASLRRDPDGACQAALDLARLEARHAEDLQTAYLQAYRTAARFGRDGRHTACVAQARRMLAVLEGYQPPLSVLAPIDADPDADDPGVAQARAQSLQQDAPAVRLLRLESFAGGEVDANSVRLVLHFDGPPLFRRGELAATTVAPRRVFLQFEGVRPAPRLGRLPEAGSGGILALRLSRERGELRFSAELSANARYRLFSMEDPHRLVLDVQRQRGGEVVRRAQEPLILLDPGHGGEDHGSVGYHGLTEARLSLDIARRVRRWIARIAPGLRVRLTRDSDVFLALEERAAMANALGAALFVSVHLNASSQPVERGGVATFVLDVNNERNVLRLAARENGTATRAVTQLQFLVGSLARAEQARESRVAARLIQQGTLFGGRRLLPRLHDRGVRSAMFYVLVGAQMPAVLVEASFLSQREEAAMLARTGYREALAEGIARGAVRYLSTAGGS